MMFLDCPAYLDQDGTARCGLPAEIRCRFTMRSTDGPIECAMIRCPAGHGFNGSIESLTWDGTDQHDPDAAGLGSRAGRDTLQHRHGGREVSADPPRAPFTPSLNKMVNAGTALRPTIWATPPPCGSPSCARAASAPPAGTRSRPPSPAVTPPGTPAYASTADSPAIGTRASIPRAAAHSASPPDTSG